MVKNYIRSIAEIDAAIEPFKEQRKELRKEFVDNGWLTKEEIKAAMKAYSLLKQQMDFDELEAMYNRMRPNEEE
jgi:polyhydroxyalkanoate synthesis regulator phasin